MKKIIFFLICAFSCIVQVNAQAYYYFNGSKRPIEIAANKFVAIFFTPSDKLETTPSIMELEAKTVSGKSIKVYQCDDASIMEMLTERSKAENDWYLMSCYYTDIYGDLVPVGLINVRLKKADDYPKLEQIANQYQLEIVRQNKFMPLWYVLEVTGKTTMSVLDIANQIYETGVFQSSSPFFDSNSDEISYDPSVFKQWGLYNPENEGVDISVSQAWNFATGRGVKIGIVDSGFDIQHIDLNTNIFSSYDANADSVPCLNFGFHGTHCAGIAAAIRNNGIHIAGVAPDAKLMCTNYKGSTLSYTEGKANGINWAWRNGADIISCSWSNEENDMIKEAIDSALERGRNGLGCIFVKSAGNNGNSGNPEITFPGNYRPEIIAVANLTKTGSLNISSSYGANMFVAAPGTNILSTIPDNITAFCSGTSMAVPHVAGVVAMMLERNPNLTIHQVREIIATNAKKIGNYPYNQTKEFGTWNEHSGYGIVDAYHSVISTPRYQDMNNQ